MANNNNNGSENTVSVEELLLSQTYTMQAIVNLLERKGIMTREEIIEEMQTLQAAFLIDDEEKQ